MIFITDEEFKQLASYVNNHYGLNLKLEKKYLIEGRLYQQLIDQQCQSFNDYYKYIINDKTGLAIAALINKLTTNHTFFMRESEHFHYFKDIVLPYLSLQANQDLRIWSAGCSTGEEPYTIAMMVADHFASNQNLWDTKILATDISTQALEAAKLGVYRGDQIAALPVHWQNNYFTKYDHNNYKIADKIRNEVIFRRFNLVNKVFPFNKKFQVIFCRNVMIYFDASTKNSLLNRFYEATEPGGYLFVGHSESLDRNAIPYKYVRPAVYRKE